MTLLNMAALDDDAFHTKDLMKDTANLLEAENSGNYNVCLLYTSPSPRDKRQSRMPSSA